MPGRTRARTRQAALLLVWGAACGLCAAQPTEHTLANGLRTAWSASRGYDAVACAIACPQTTDRRLIGLPEVVCAALGAGAEQPRGPRSRVGRLGGDLTISVRDGCILVEAAAPPGFGSELLRAVRDTLTPPPAAALLASGGLTERLRTLSSGEPPATGEAQRKALGPAWYASPAEIAATCAAFEARELDRVLAEWLVGRRLAVAAATGTSRDQEWIVDQFGSLPAGQAVAAWERTPTAGAEVRTSSHAGQSALALVVGGPAPPAPGAAAWMVAAQLLGEGNLGWAFQELRTRLGLSYQAAGEWKIEDGGLLWLECHCDPGDEDAVDSALQSLVARLAAEGPSDEELERARRGCRTALARMESAPARRARLSALGMAWGYEAAWTARLGKAIPDVAAEDIRRVGETYSRHCVRVRVESETDAR